MEKAKQLLNDVLLKSRTSIQGFDEITGGGIPAAGLRLYVARQGVERLYFQ